MLALTLPLGVVNVAHMRGLRQGISEARKMRILWQIILP